MHICIHARSGNLVVDPLFPEAPLSSCKWIGRRVPGASRLGWTWCLTRLRRLGYLQTQSFVAVCPMSWPQPKMCPKVKWHNYSRAMLGCDFAAQIVGAGIIMPLQFWGRFSGWVKMSGRQLSVCLPLDVAILAQVEGQALVASLAPYFCLPLP